MSWQEADRQRFEAIEAAAAGVSLKKGSKTWDPASVANGANTTTTVTVTGAAVGDPVLSAFSVALPAGVSIDASVTAADTVTVTLTNTSGGAVDLASGTLKAVAFKW